MTMQCHSIRWQLLAAFMALVTVSVALTGIWLGWHEYHHNLDTAYALQQEVAKRVAVQVQAELERSESEISQGIRAVDFLHLPDRERERFMDRLLADRDFFREVSFIDAAGIRRLHRSNVRLLMGSDDPAGLSAPDSTRFGLVYYDLDNNEPLMLVEFPVKDPRSGSTAGVLAAEVRLKRIWTLIGDIALKPGEDVYLLDQARRVIAHRNPSVVLRETAFSPNTGARRQTGLLGNEAFVATQQFEIGQQAFTIVAERDVALALAPAMASLKLTLVAMLVSLAAVFVLLIPISRRITEPIVAVAETARAIRDGDLERRAQVDRKDEIGELANSFNDMTARLSTSLRQLEGERTQLRTLLRTIPDLVWFKDTNGVYLACNAAFEGFFGASEADIVGKTDHDFVDNALADFFRERDRAAVAAGQPVSNEEWITYACDGLRRLVLATKTPVWSSDGTMLGVLGIARDITAQRQAENELLTAHKDLQAFTYAASHDMKAPLGRINSFSGLLERDYRDRLEGNGILFLDHIRTNAKRLMALVEDLLIHAEIEQRELALQPVNLREVLAGVVGEYEVEIRKGGVDIGIDAFEVTVLADIRYLRQALRNLLENALKYSSKVSAPAIRFGIHTQDGRCRLWIKDNGIGFDMVYHDRIFEVFRRLHTYEEYPGSGIGLALAKKAIERIGGAIWAESEPGLGATFYLELKVASKLEPARIQ